MPSEQLTEALRCAERGWPVFPLHSIKDGKCTCGKLDCGNPGKHPRVKNGFHAATTDKETIQRWWKRWPNSNYGIVTGSISGIVVVDIDPENGGDESYEWLVENYEKLPDTVESITGKRGTHIFLKHPQNGMKIPSRSSFADMPGLDIRGEGGYVVGPQSMHERGTRYEWSLLSSPDDVSLAPMPDWLIRLAQKKSSHQQQEEGSKPKWVTEALKGVPEGQRNDTCFRLAQYFRPKLPEDTTLNILLDFASKCTPPMDEDEVRKTVRSAYTFSPAASLSNPEIQYGQGIYFFNFPNERVQIRIERISEKSDSIVGEITVTTQAPGVPKHLHQAKLNLTSTQSRTNLAKYLNARFNLDWNQVLETVCTLTLQKYREGEPVKRVGIPTQINKPKYLLYPLLLENEANLIYGTGGTGKSLVAMTLSLIIQSGYSVCGLEPSRQANVLYLDYETSWEEANEKVQLLKMGLDFPSEANFLYRFCYSPFPYEVADIQKIVIENNIGCVVIDSYGMACGADAWSQQIARDYFMGLRSLKVTSLTVDHVPKDDQNSIFGSVYKYNEARNIFQIHAEPEMEREKLEIGLHHRKTNTGKLVGSLGLRFNFYEEGILTERVEKSEVPGAFSKLPLKEQIAEVLRKGEMTVGEIAEETGANKESVRRKLNDNRNRFIKLDRQKWGLVSSDNEA